MRGRCRRDSPRPRGTPSPLSCGVQASPTNYDKIAANRPDALAINFAMCSTPAMVHFLDGAKLPHPIHGSHEAVGGILEFMPASHISRWFSAPLLHSGIVDAGGAVVNDAMLDALPWVIRVPCYPPAVVLRRLGIFHIDFWVLDVEGGEAAVLQAFDFSPETGVTVDVIVMEANNIDAPDFQPRVQLLAKAGLLQDPGLVDYPNYWFVRQGFKPSRKS